MKQRRGRIHAHRPDAPGAGKQIIQCAGLLRVLGRDAEGGEPGGLGDPDRRARLVQLVLGREHVGTLAHERGGERDGQLRGQREIPQRQRRRREELGRRATQLRQRVAVGIALLL